MLKFLIILVFCVQFKVITANTGEAWVTRASVIDDVEYFLKVIQEFCYELERREWSSLKMVDIRQNIDTVIANWHVNGSVLYTNGFVISIEKLDVSLISSLFTRTIVDNVLIPSATVRGTLNFRNLNVGYDVLTDLTGRGEESFTGSILSNIVAWSISITKNLITQEITVSVLNSSIEGRFLRMIYRPENRVTEFLSRNFGSSDNSNGYSSWTASFREILTDIVTNKVDFPRICFTDCE